MTSEFFLRNFIKPIKWTNSSKKDGIIKSIEWTDSSRMDEILLSPYNGRIHPWRMEEIHKKDGSSQEGENIIKSNK